MQKNFPHPSEVCTPIQPAQQTNRNDPWRPSIYCPQRYTQRVGLFFGLVSIGSTQQHLGVEENMRVSKYRVFFKDVLVRGFFNTANKMTTIKLLLVKQVMCLVSTIQYGSLARFNNFADKGSFGPFAFS